MEYILILLQNNAPSFCHYNRSVSSYNTETIMSLADFRNAINFALKNCLKINILLGDKGMSELYLKELIGVDYVVLAPPSGAFEFENQIYVVDYEGSHSVFDMIPKKSEQNIILRMNSDFLPDLGEIIKRYSSQFQRINLFVKDITDLSSDKLNEYRDVLRTLTDITYENLVLGGKIELNFLTDRIYLEKMNNCDAGIRHITFAPNGNFYLCPGFYYDGVRSVGNLTVGIDISHEILKLENAPICNICDAFHCKRCVYLNQKTTLQMNTPSREQCVLSHLERNETKRLIDKLRRKKRFSHFPLISQISYLDPFEIVKQNPSLKRGWQINEKEISDENDSLSDRELLNKIFDIQIELKNKLDKFMKSN